MFASHIICALSLLIEDYHTFLKCSSLTSTPESLLLQKQPRQKVTQNFFPFSNTHTCICCVCTRAKDLCKLGKVNIAILGQAHCFIQYGTKKFPFRFRCFFILFSSTVLKRGYTVISAPCNVHFHSIPFRSVPFRSVPFHSVLIFLC